MKFKNTILFLFLNFVYFFVCLFFFNKKLFPFFVLFALCVNVFAFYFPIFITKKFQLSKIFSYKNTNLNKLMQSQKNIKFLQFETEEALAISFGFSWNKNIAISQNLSSYLSNKELEIFVKYLLFLTESSFLSVKTFLSALLYTVHSFLKFLGFQKEKIWVCLFYLLKNFLPFKYLTFKDDKKFVSQFQEEAQILLKALWKLQSVQSSFNNSQYFPLLLLSPTNLLTTKSLKKYLSLHPDLRFRIKNLGSNYPV